MNDPPRSADDSPAASEDDTARWQAATQLRIDHPGWLVLWIAGQHHYAAYPLFTSRQITVTAAQPAGLAAQMRDFEQAFPRRRASPPRTRVTS